MITTLIFVRHAEAEGNKNRIFHGWTDSDITEKGHMQAQKVAERLKNCEIDLLYSSTLMRAWKTAEYIAKLKGLSVIRKDRLKEINGGDWENVQFCKFPMQWPNEFQTWEYELHRHKMPNGETVDEFRDRLVAEIKDIISNNEGKSICIVTHGTAIRVLLSYFYGSPETINNIRWCDNTAVSVVEVDKDRYSVIMQNDASHIADELSSLYMYKSTNNQQI